MPSDFRASLVGAPGKGSYPLAFFEYLLVHRHLRSLPHVGSGTRQAIKDFMLWIVESNAGQTTVRTLLLIPPVLAGSSSCHGQCTTPANVPALLRTQLNSIGV